MQTTRILAAVDRFPEDDAVLVRAHQMAAQHDVALTIVHVIDMPRHTVSPALIGTFRGQAEFAARDRIEAALRRQRIDRDSTEICIETGSPGRKLVEICNYLRPALVVMRARHRPWIVGKLLGSTTQTVIDAGRAPVLVVRQTSGRPYDRVLLAIDGPENALASLSFVSALLPDAANHLVQAVQVTPQLENAMLRIGMAQADLVAHRDFLAQDVESSLRSLTADMVPRVTWQVVRGEPAPALARAVQEAGVDLIALGPNRSGLLRRTFVGSVARRLLRDAVCDVLIAGPIPPRLARAPTTGFVGANMTQVENSDPYSLGGNHDYYNSETKPADPNRDDQGPEHHLGA